MYIVAVLEKAFIYDTREETSYDWVGLEKGIRILKSNSDSVRWHR